ncbi:hypothetical protein ACJRO7_021359 [Eucalyptus globulus]|uniref:Uncharacterized protein n=1 Tax=Eucalyptus globulus TaxID=34317 RepID=A0ABD3KKB8_EUCGL
MIEMKRSAHVQEEMDEDLAPLIKKNRKVMFVLPNVDSGADVDTNVLREDSTHVTYEENVKAVSFVNSTNPEVLGALADINDVHPVIVAEGLTCDSSKKATDPNTDRVASLHKFVPTLISSAKHDLNSNLPSIGVNVDMPKLRLEEEAMVTNTIIEHVVIETQEESEMVKLLKKVTANMEEFKGKFKALKKELREEVKALDEELNKEAKVLKDGMATLKEGYKNYLIRLEANLNPSFFTDTPSSSK